MSNVSAARAVFQLSRNELSPDGKSLGLSEAQLILAALVGFKGKIDGDGIMEMQRVLGGKNLNPEARELLTKELAARDGLTRVFGGMTDRARLEAMNAAFIPTQGPEDESIKPLTDVQVQGLSDKVQTTFEDVKDELKSYFTAQGAGNDEYGFNDAQVFPLSKDGALLGYAVLVTGGWDTQVEGNVVFVTPDGVRLASVTDEE